MNAKPCAFITGGGTGIGRAAAERFVREGWRVVAAGRRPGPLETLRDRFPADVLALPLDLTSVESVEAAARKLAHDDVFGKSLTALVNNAGIVERRSFTETPDSLWLSTFETNLFGAVRITRALLPRLQANRGVIINVSSNLGLRPIALTSAYSASKAAMINWTQALAIELGSSGVRCNCVCPGIVDTPIQSFHGKPAGEKQALAGLQPLGRVGEPEDIAHGIWSLCAQGSEWTTGAVLTIDGGIHLGTAP